MVVLYFPPDYYISLFKCLGLLAVSAILAMFGAVMFFLIKNICYAYSNGKHQKENRYWVYYVKDEMKCLKELCWNFEWVKQIIHTIKKASTSSNERPNNSLGLRK